MSNNGHIDRGGKQRSISTKISISLIGILLPALILLIAVSCMTAAGSITSLNKKLLKSQADRAVAIVDGFFSSKLAAVSMYQEDAELQDFFMAVKSPEQIADYENTGIIIADLASALERMSAENVQQTWIASMETDTYLLSTGETVAADLNSMDWVPTVYTEKQAMVTDPFLDPASGEIIVSIVTPVMSRDGSQVLGIMGMDIYMEKLAETLDKIHIGNEGFLELNSLNNDYIYSNDPTAIGKNVNSLNISDDYKTKITSNYEGTLNFQYGGIDYTALTQMSDVTGWLTIATLPINEINSTRNQMVGTMAGISVVILLIISAAVVGLIHRSLKPLAEISRTVEEFAGGRLNVDVQVKTDDEIGRLAASVQLAIRNLKAIIGDITQILLELSDGNLDVPVSENYVGDFSPIRTSLEGIIRSLNLTMGQISQSSEQVSSGADQVASGAQALSQGAAEQASSIEELLATITEISLQVERSAANAEQASHNAASVAEEANVSSRRMQEMLDAMSDISASAGEIGDIIKAIEEIAFQTNILAVNAAVEAAHAGTAGKGFAVVADEIRSLAGKSAASAKTTAALIERSLEAVKNGTKIADETAQSLESVVRGVQDASAAIQTITAASRQQSSSIRQVTHGIDQISGVVQTNSATAEESAAASEELSGQSQLLKIMVDRFRLADITPDDPDQNT